MVKEKVISEITNQSDSGNNVIPPVKEQFPWLVTILIAISWILFIISMYKNNCPAYGRAKECFLLDILGRFSFEDTYENTQLGPSKETLQEMGGLELKPGDKDTKNWHIFTSIFLHSGLASLILSTISLLFQAIGLEKTFGVVRIGLLYYLSGLGGSLWSLYKFHMSVYSGASAAVTGISGAAFSDLIINWKSLEKKFKNILRAVLGLGINLFISILPGVDLTAYYGGLWTGFFLGFLFLIREQAEQAGVAYIRYQCVLWFISLILIVIGFAWIFVTVIIR